jgi:uracil-DNA glycosylase
MTGSPSISDDALAPVIAGLRACRICRDQPRYGAPLAHEPRPVIQAEAGARLCIASQAPGTRAHASGRPFTDASGVRLRTWLGIPEEVFYDPARVAIVPMASCFPGQDAKGGDLPPRRECAETWRAPIFAALPRLELILTIGGYAQSWHLGPDCESGLTATVKRWRAIVAAPRRPRILPMPHPSWRNNGWLRKNPWFEAELVPALQNEVRALLA